MTFTNVSGATFTGTLSDTALAGGVAPDFSFSSPVTLAPGQSFAWAINSEASNQGGYNGPTGTTQPGVILTAIGSFSDGSTLNASINDSQIHSGVFATNPFGVTLDNYVLQGGDPLGRDTGDTFELAQAQGVAFLGTAPGPVPGAGFAGLAALAFAGLYARTRRA